MVVWSATRTFGSRGEKIVFLFHRKSEITGRASDGETRGFGAKQLALHRNRADQQILIMTPGFDADVAENRYSHKLDSRS